MMSRLHLHSGQSGLKVCSCPLDLEHEKGLPCASSMVLSPVMSFKRKTEAQRGVRFCRGFDFKQ